MGLGFSVRLAPGVRVRASSRGVRTSIGPRAARVHVGGGRAGFSTGVGPVSYYTSVGARAWFVASARVADRNRHREPSVGGRDPRDCEGRTGTPFPGALQTITSLHRVEFEPARRPVAPEPSAVDEISIRREHTKQARAATSFFARRARKAA